MGSPETNIDRLLKARAELDEALRRFKTSLAVFFTDIVGSTSFFERYGDTAGLSMLRRHADVATAAVEEFQGRVVKTIGDSILADFGEAEPAVRAAVEIQRRQLEVNQGLAEHERFYLRIGVHSGVVFRSSADVFGDVVNLAARITKHTGPAQILVSRAVHDAIASLPDLPCNWVEKIYAEGKTEKEDVFEVVWTDLATYTEIRRAARDTTLRHKGQEALAHGEVVATGKYVEDILTPPGRALPELSSRYEILHEVARGGMGIVYKAREKETGDIVALKILKPEVANDAAVMERFKNEVRLARRITHKNVCRIHEFNRTESLAYISMEFVEGESLRQVLRRFRTLSLRKGLETVSQICAGLQEAHSQGVVHRDLKPENIILDHAGNVKLMDFGVARSLYALGHTATLVGTPAYMSPEQAEGTKIDLRADIYSLGLILYEVFTGAPAFQGESPVEVALKQIRDTPPRPRELEPTLPEKLGAIIMRCIEKNPAQRFQSVEELSGALQQVAAELAPETPAPAPRRASPLQRMLTRRNLVGLGAVAALVIAGLLLQTGKQVPQSLDNSDAVGVQGQQSEQLASGTTTGSATPPVSGEPPKPEPPKKTTQPELKPTPQQAKPQETKPAPTESTSPQQAKSELVTSTPERGFYLRLGSFGKESEADQWAGQLKRLGYPVVIVQRRRTASLWRRSYDLMVGPYDKAEAAQAQQQRLEQRGFRAVQLVEERTGN